MSNFGGAVRESRVFDFALLGVPFDGKSSFRRGPAKGPQAIRAASTDEAINAWTELEVNLEEESVLVDLGDVDVSGPYGDILARIENRVAEILEKNAVPLILGGDHSITYPAVRAFARRFKALDILHFDAHPDLYGELYGDRFSHACPFARILEEGLVQNMVQVGIRAAIGEHRRTASQHGVRTVAMRDITDSLVLEFRNPLYISFDMDVLDPAFAPGVSHHEPGGLTTRQALRILHALKAEVVGLDVVEMNPDWDVSGITAAAAVKVVMEAAGKVVATRRSLEKEDR